MNELNDGAGACHHVRGSRSSCKPAARSQNIKAKLTRLWRLCFFAASELRNDLLERGDRLPGKMRQFRVADASDNSTSGSEVQAHVPCSKCAERHNRVALAKLIDQTKRLVWVSSAAPKVHVECIATKVGRDLRRAHGDYSLRERRNNSLERRIGE